MSDFNLCYLNLCFVIYLFIDIHSTWTGTLGKIDVRRRMLEKPLAGSGTTTYPIGFSLKKLKTWKKEVFKTLSNLSEAVKRSCLGTYKKHCISYYIDSCQFI